ncbi:DUF3027 domain-containing protein [Corynebacterium doosanense]|uniref:DUF3027 domain-containing protein n=1 Tax=Corynebacterium doosanense CAU 212 = DSM 45436 TaxID=558173 RepID=A0A097IEF2_9CORY|nr:hypothetical protein CDOO_04060 [Corynebacterium doosanense CAU 212 = DSM 45436]
MKGVSQPKKSSPSRSAGGSTHRRGNNPLLSRRAVELSREMLEQLGDGEVGRHIGVSGLERNVATHRFEAAVPGYPGWEWNVVVACASGSEHVTVNETALVPAPSGNALQAPEWVPYSERLLPGDLGPGDLMPPAPDDHRLTPDPDEAGVEAAEGRRHYLTRRGLDEAKQRWRTGEYGPGSEFAEKATLHCRTCAFYLPAADPVGENFGVCANEYSADGILVHATYGCGAHSETVVHETPAAQDAFDDESPVF